MSKDFDAILISETHWDRAWYLTFQQFRLRLVKLVDRLLDILDKDPSFKTFTFDGQTVVLEDYLEVKPENRERLVSLIKDGRIDVGPWYVLPDVYLVSGEALLRNLQRGTRIAREFGRLMDVGYIPDPFGHVSQLPMILSQSGYDSVIFARGAGDEVDDLGSEFIWEGQDGSEVMAHWLPLSYGNAANLPEEIDDAVSMLEDVVDKLKPWSRTGTLLLMNGSDHLFPQPHVPDVIREFNSRNETKIEFGTLPGFVKRIREKKESLKHFKGEFRRSKYQNLLSGVYSTRVYLKQMNEYSQRLLERWVEPWCTIAGILGHQYPEKEIEHAWKYLLRNHPHDDICGCSIDEVHDDMEQRFRWIKEIGEALLEDALSHIGDNYRREHPGIQVINPSPFQRTGIAIAEIAVSDFRFTRLADIQLSDTSLDPSSPLEAAKNEVHISFVKSQGFDPTPVAERELEIGNKTIIEFEFDFTGLAILFPQLKDALRHLSTVYRIRVNEDNQVVEVFARKHDAEDLMKGRPVLTDNKGNNIPVQVLSHTMRKDNKSHLVADREEFLTLAIQVEDIRGLGIEHYDLSISDDDDQRFRKDSVYCEENAVENSHVRIEVATNGTVTLTDKRSGEVYSGLLEFEDSEDVGDSYDYCPSREHQVIRSKDIEVSIEEGHTGPLIGSLIITGELELPETVDNDLSGRAEDTVCCTFTTEVSIHAGDPTVRVSTEFDNQARDHRLRVLFPSGTESKTCSADSAFDVISRPVRPEKKEGWFQPVADTYPLRSFVSMSSGMRGLTITTRGLLEYEVLEDAGGTIALTALRSIGWLSRIDMKTRAGAAGPVLETPGAQCIGMNTFEFAITPHTEDWLTSKSFIDSEEYLFPLHAYYVAGGEQIDSVLTKGHITIEPKTLKLSALKYSQDGEGIVLRFWNISETEQECTIYLGFDVSSAKRTLADETLTIGSEVTLVDKRTIKTTISPKQLVTVLLERRVNS